LKQAGFLHSPQRAYYSITEAGLQAHKTGDIINVEYLRRIPQFGRFYSQPRTNTDNTQQTPVEIINNTNTPDETITLAYRTLRDTLAAELLERLMNLSPRFFEQAVLDVLIAMGYGGSRSDAARRVGQSGDGGIDGIINEDRLGLDVIYLQAKRWENTIGAPQLRDFAGSLEERKAIKGIFITTSDFTREARDYVNRIGKRIILINGTELAQFMIDFGVGVLERETYVLKRIDEEYFEE
jgi:restriction system protein